MDREGIYTARSAREIGADGEGKAGGSNAEKAASQSGESPRRAAG